MRHLWIPVYIYFNELFINLLNNQGTNPNELAGSNTAVIIGCHSSSDTHHGLYEEMIDISPFALTGCQATMLANRISYNLDINGPSYTIKSSGTSSAQAFNDAITHIKYGDCDSALVCGTMLDLRPTNILLYDTNKMLSRDGKCKFLDANADGYVRSESCCVLYLQKSSDAKRIYASVVGIKSNNNGFKEEGPLFPSYKAQYLLMKSTLKEANIDPNSVQYIEANGTGIQLEDQCECEAIARAYCEDRCVPLLVGSIKTNMGHCEAASTLASIAKVLITFETGVIPASLHFTAPNPYIPALINGIIKPVVENTEFNDGIVAINSFDSEGNNVHILLRPNTNKKSEMSIKLPRLIPLFGRTNDCLNYLASFCAKNSTKINTNFLYMLNDIANISGMNFRDYLLIDEENNHDNTPEQDLNDSFEKITDRRPLWFIFSGKLNKIQGCARCVFCVSTYQGFECILVILF